VNANHGTVDAGIRAALTALLLLIGCPGDPADDDVSGDDDLSADDDDATDDDDDVTEAPPGCLGDPGPAPGPGVCADEAPCRWDGNGDGAKFGYAITAGKDFDGDGLPDFAVGAKGYTEIDDEGRVMLYPSTVATEDDPPAPGVFVGPQPLAYAGFSVTLVDDMDGDGLAELVVGATGVEDIPGQDLPPNVGAAYLIPGAPLPDPDPDSGQVELTAATVFYGESYYARTGWASAGAGDVDGDGLGDLLLSGELQNYTEDGEECRQGRVYLHLGRAQGFEATVSNATADAILDGDEADEMAGESLAGGHDLDGDDVPDLVVGAPYAGSYAGKAYVVSGAAVAGGGSFELADVGAVLTGDGDSYDAFGWTVASVGDLTGDGLGEIAVGVPGHDEPGSAAGALWLYPGDPGLAQGIAPPALATISGEWWEHDFGIRAVGGDVDGDGSRDLVASAIYAHQGFNGMAGRIYVFGGRDAASWALVTSAADSDADYTGAGVRDYLGFGLALGDLDLDGADDLLMGAAYHDTADAEDQGRVYLFWGG
jgi:hypothetical protein